MALLLYEILSWFTHDRLVKINIIKIFLLPLYSHVSLFLHHMELPFKDIPTKTYLKVEYNTNTIIYDVD